VVFLPTQSPSTLPQKPKPIFEKTKPLAVAVTNANSNTKGLKPFTALPATCF